MEHALHKHTVKSYEDELVRLSRAIAEMGGVAESQLEWALRALTTRDLELAKRTVANDARIDAFEENIHDDAVRLLALRQPMGIDLREIVSVFRISSNLERVGDLSKSVARRVEVLNALPPLPQIHALRRMGKEVIGQLKDVLDAYVDRNADRAVAVWRKDELVDGMYNSLFRESLTYMMEDARTISACTHLLFVAKHIERIGDHCTNIAETIHYLVHGERIADERPKGDETEIMVQ